MILREGSASQDQLPVYKTPALAGVFVFGDLSPGGATKDFGRFRGGVVGGGVFVWASGFRTGGPVWGYLT